RHLGAAARPGAVVRGPGAASPVAGRATAPLAQAHRDVVLLSGAPDAPGWRAGLTRLRRSGAIGPPYKSGDTTKRSRPGACRSAPSTRAGVGPRAKTKPG